MAVCSVCEIMRELLQQCIFDIHNPYAVAVVGVAGFVVFIVEPVPESVVVVGADVTLEKEHMSKIDEWHSVFSQENIVNQNSL